MDNQLIATFHIIILTIALCGCRPADSDYGKLSAELATADSLYQSGNHTEAMRIAMDISTISNEKSFHYLTAKAEELIADISDDINDHAGELSHRIKAAKEYLMADSILAHRYALLDLAAAHVHNSDMSSACLLLDSLRLACPPTDSAFIADCMRSSLLLAVYVHDYISVEDLAHDLEDYRKFYTPDATDYSCMAISLINYRIDYHPYLDSARMAIKSQADNEMVAFAMAKCLKSEYKYVERNKLLDSVAHFDTIIQPSHQNLRIFDIQRNHYDKQAKKQSEQSRVMKAYLMFCIIIAVMIITGLITFHRLKIRIKNEEIDNYVESANQISQELSSEISENLSIRNHIEKLYHERWNTINLLSNEFFEKSDSANARTSILNEIEKELERMRSPRKLKQIEELTNNYMDNIVADLRTQCTFLNDDDITFIMLIYAGFSPRAVCLFTGIKLKYFYTKRSRITARIMASDAPDCERFASKL